MLSIIFVLFLVFAFLFFFEIDLCYCDYYPALEISYESISSLMLLASNILICYN